MAGLLEINQVGKREDFADVIAMIDFKNTPFSSMCPKGSEPVNTIYDWQMDAYDDPVLGGIIDGKDVVDTDYVNPAARRAKAHGRIQKFRKAFMVSDMAQNVSDVAGIGRHGEMQRAIKKSILELKRSMEATFCSDQVSQADNGSTLAYLTRAVGNWVSNAAGTDLPTPAAFVTPTASILTMTTATMLEDDVNGAMQSIYSQTGQQKDFDLICGTNLKKRFSSFAAWVPSAVSTVPLRRFNQDADSKAIINTVDFWQGDFGGVKLILSLFLAYDSAVANVRNGRGYLIDWDQFELRYNRMPGYKENPDLGGGPRGYVDAVCGLVVYNPLGLGKIAPTA
ncbi:MAG TPA: DUF5309 family protein [Chthoniobacterales bacterium]|nr:DUF5309 family protein [Chthoniobacterales bacterium]